MNYDPRIFVEDNIIDSSGIVGWIGRKRKNAICKTINQQSIQKRTYRLLDVGCGFGEILSEASATFKVGVDINEAAIKKAQKIAKDSNFVLCDVERLPFKDNSFDAVICSEVLEHVENPTVVSIEICNICRTDGLIGLSVPNEIVTTLGRFLLKKKPYKSPAHKWAFNWKKIKQLFLYHVVESSNIPFKYLPFVFSTNLVCFFKKNE